MNKSSMPEASWKYIVEKYLSNTCTREELQQLLQRVEQDPDNEHLIQELRAHWESLQHDLPEDDTAHWHQRLDSLLARESNPPPKRLLRYLPVIAAAASVLLLVAVGIKYFYHLPKNKTAVHAVAHDVAPGGNKAMLTLADGSVISLDSAANGLVARQGNTTISKLQNGQLNYNNQGAAGEQQFNTLSIPKGGKYMLLLPDGSKVWLNAASTLNFPLAFGNTRTVKLTGEAYFDIAPDPKRPFLVQVNNMEIQVLGTAFNIMAYKEEGQTKTTLVNGALAISNASKKVILKPGQQASVTPGKPDIEVGEADMDEALAWKNERFYFNNTDIQTAARQLERWYNVEVTFRDSLNMRLNGTISREVNISRVLKMLTLTGEANFTIVGRSITVGK